MAARADDEELPMPLDDADTMGAEIDKAVAQVNVEERWLFANRADRASFAKDCFYPPEAWMRTQPQAVRDKAWTKAQQEAATFGAKVKEDIKAFNTSLLRLLDAKSPIWVKFAHPTYEGCFLFAPGLEKVLILFFRALRRARDGQLILSQEPTEEVDGWIKSGVRGFLAVVKGNPDLLAACRCKVEDGDDALIKVMTLAWSRWRGAAKARKTISRRRTRIEPGNEEFEGEEVYE